MQHTKVRVPGGDVLIFCGDMCTTGTIGQAIKTSHFLNKLPHKHKIIVAGNHDFPFAQMDPHVIVPRGVSYLCDTSMRVRVPDTDILLKIHGMPWTPEFYNWAFMMPRNSEQMSRRVDEIPDNVDILITHGPPYGILDEAPTYIKREPIGMSHEGCMLLRDRVLKIQPKLHVFGHIHNRYGSVTINDVLFVNAALCDDQHVVMHNPVIVDYINGQMRVIEEE